MQISDSERKRCCPDNGACHHDCTQGCFRVNYCDPFSGVYRDDQWPESVRGIPLQHGDPVTQRVIDPTPVEREDTWDF